MVKALPSAVPSASWPIDLDALPPDWLHSAFVTAAWSDIGIAEVARSSCASLSVVSTGMRSPRTGVFFSLCLSTLHPLAAISAAIRIAVRKCFGLIIMVLWVRCGRRLTGIDAKAAGDLDGAGSAAFRSILVLGDRREQPACLLLLALLDHRYGGHLTGAGEPGIARLRQRFRPRDHVVGLEAVEFERGHADQRGVTVGLGQAVIRRNFLIFGDCELVVILLDSERGPRKQRRGADPLLATLGQRIELLRRGTDRSGTNIRVDLREVLDMLLRAMDLILLPVNPATAGREEQDQRANQPAAIFLGEVPSPVAPQVLVDLAEECLIDRVRGLRQEASVRSVGILCRRFLPHPG